MIQTSKKNKPETAYFMSKSISRIIRSVNGTNVYKFNNKKPLIVTLYADIIALRGKLDSVTETDINGNVIISRYTDNIRSYAPKGMTPLSYKSYKPKKQDEKPTTDLTSAAINKLKESLSENNLDDLPITTITTNMGEAVVEKTDSKRSVIQVGNESFSAGASFDDLKKTFSEQDSVKKTKTTSKKKTTAANKKKAAKSGK